MILWKQKKGCLVVHYSVPEFSFTLHFVFCNDEPYSDGQFTNQPPSLSVTDCIKESQNLCDLWGM